MFERCLRFRLDTPLGRVTTIAVGLVLLLPTATPVSAQFTKALDCNSQLKIALGTQTGNTVPVTLTLTRPRAAFEVRDGLEMTQVLDVRRTRVTGNEWILHLVPGHLHVIAVPDGSGWFGRSAPVNPTSDPKQGGNVVAL